MDASTEDEEWPSRPYRGLKFYRERHARLFCERDSSIRQCAETLLGFGVKILVLQGSSGAGKSSFLRAGLIPYLQRDIHHRSVFLDKEDVAIRCTSDPLPAIANELINALATGNVVRQALAATNIDDGDLLIRGDIRNGLDMELRALLSGPRRRLASGLVNALQILYGELSGKLILVLDQAEEVLTRSSDEPSTNEAAAAFFYFLEEVYLENLDVRIIVSLRTEYYGRFRDELRISDDRLTDRPKRGGVEPYLLRSLRDRDALLRVVRAPTEARYADGRPAYNFGTIVSMRVTYRKEITGKANNFH